jgi:hypothetical protein
LASWPANESRASGDDPISRVGSKLIVFATDVSITGFVQVMGTPPR